MAPRWLVVILRYLIEHHYLPRFLWLTFQITLGALLAHKGVLRLGETTLVDVSKHWLKDKLFSWHALSGTILQVDALVLLLFAFIPVFTGVVSRSKIPNLFVRMAIKFHFLTLSSLYLTQYLTMGPYSSLVTQYTGWKSPTLATIHSTNGFVIYALVVVLITCKIYLITRRQRDSTKTD